MYNKLFISWLKIYVLQYKFCSVWNNYWHNDGSSQMLIFPHISSYQCYLYKYLNLNFSSKIQTSYKIRFFFFLNWKHRRGDWKYNLFLDLIWIGFLIRTVHFISEKHLCSACRFWNNMSMLWIHSDKYFLSLSFKQKSNAQHEQMWISYLEKHDKHFKIQPNCHQIYFSLEKDCN